MPPTNVVVFCFVFVPLNVTAGVKCNPYTIVRLCTFGSKMDFPMGL